MRKRVLALALVFILGIVSTACAEKLPAKEEMKTDKKMGYTADFIYNKTGEYIMVEFMDCDNFSEIARAFREME